METALSGRTCACAWSSRIAAPAGSCPCGCSSACSRPRAWATRWTRGWRRTASRGGLWPPVRSASPSAARTSCPRCSGTRDRCPRNPPPGWTAALRHRGVARYPSNPSPPRAMARTAPARRAGAARRVANAEDAGARRTACASLHDGGPGVRMTWMGELEPCVFAGGGGRQAPLCRVNDSRDWKRCARPRRDMEGSSTSYTHVHVSAYVAVCVA
mmetsp:Transcript_15806/g.53216  ORF Transcript_15806/g.53216 Transcript_15806/m.53216 type:complete len:214 (-) Transcript_15806:109-750(-)